MQETPLSQKPIVRSKKTKKETSFYRKVSCMSPVLARMSPVLALHCYFVVLRSRLHNQHCLENCKSIMAANAPTFLAHFIDLFIRLLDQHMT